MENELFEKTRDAVISAGALLRNRTLAGDSGIKDDGGFVTAVDMKVQDILRAELARILPEAGFLGEEGPREEGWPAEYMWILDPVDGTSNLIHDFRHSAVSLALTREGRTVMGLVYDPFLNELFSARMGGGAKLNGAPIKVSAAEGLSCCNISVGTAPGRREESGRVFDTMLRVYDSCHDIRRTGSAALELCYVAAGRQDGYYEFGLRPWDVAAGLLIVREAGGVALTPDGREIPLDCPSDIVAAGPGVWPELAEIVRQTGI